MKKPTAKVEDQINKVNSSDEIVVHEIPYFADEPWVKKNLESLAQSQRRNLYAGLYKLDYAKTKNKKPSADDLVVPVREFMGTQYSIAMMGGMIGGKKRRPSVRKAFMVGPCFVRANAIIHENGLGDSADRSAMGDVSTLIGLCEYDLANELAILVILGAYASSEKILEALEYLEEDESTCMLPARDFAESLVALETEDSDEGMEDDEEQGELDVDSEPEPPVAISDVDVEIDDLSSEDLKAILHASAESIDTIITSSSPPIDALTIERLSGTITDIAWKLNAREKEALERSSRADGLNKVGENIKEAVEMLTQVDDENWVDLDVMAGHMEKEAVPTDTQKCLALSSDVVEIAVSYRDAVNEERALEEKMSKTPRSERKALLGQLTEASDKVSDLEDRLASTTSDLNHALYPESSAADPSTASDKELSASSTKELSASSTKEPSASSTKEPSAASSKEPSAASRKEPSAPAGKAAGDMHPQASSRPLTRPEKSPEENQREFFAEKSPQPDTPVGRPDIVQKNLDAAGTLAANEWPGLASFVVSAARDLYPGSLPEISPNAFRLAACGWMQTKYRDDLLSMANDLADRVLEDEPDTEWADSPDQRAVLMALLAGTTPLHIRYHSIPLRGVIDKFMVGRFGSAGPLHELCEALLEASNFNIEANLEILSGSGVTSSWQSKLAEYRERAKDWSNDEAVRRNYSYQPAKEAWQKLVSSSSTPVQAAMNIMAKGAADKNNKVKKALDKLDDPDALITSVTIKKKILGHARRQLVDDLVQTREFLNSYQDHLALSPSNTMDGADIRADKYLDSLKKRIKAAKVFVDKLKTKSNLEEGARKILLGVLGVLSDAGDGNIPDRPDADVSNMIACEFLLLDDMTFAGAPEPLPSENPVILEHAPALAKTLGTDRIKAFGRASKTRLRTHAIRSVRALNKAVSQIGSAETVSPSALDSAIKVAAEKLVGRLSKTANWINMSAAMNLVNEEKRRTFEDRIELCSVERITSLVSKDSSEDASLMMVPDFPQAFRTLDEIDGEIEDELERDTEEIRKQVKSLSEAEGSSKKDLDHILRLLENKDVLTAREYISILESGEVLPEFLWKNETLNEFAGEFLPKAEAIYGNDHNELVNDMIIALSDNKTNPSTPLIPEKLDDRQKKEFADILRAWANSTPTSVNNDIIRDVCSRGLGFDVKEVSLDRRSSSPGEVSTYTLGTEPVVLAAGKFIPPFYGSDAKGLYRLTVLGHSPTLNTIYHHLAQATGRPVIFAHCLLKTEERAALAADCRNQSYSGLVVDAALFAFLVLRNANRLANFFHVAVPYAATSPYGDSTPLPEEMFYGRESQRRDMGAERGGSLVYGGRRLGKTALLLHTQNRLDDPIDNKHVVYIDIQSVHEGAESSLFWMMISSELKSRSIINRSVKKAESVVTEIQKFLDSDPAATLLLLLDEADNFIEMEEECDYNNIRHLGTLMEKSSRRFRFVMAGLHNSQRMAKSPNNPLAKMGTPIFVGPFTDQDRAAGLQLIAEPMAAMGYEFEDQSQPLRILTQSNFYPVLIHIYCEALLNVLHKEKLSSGPPYVIRNDHLALAYDRKDFHELIRQRFRWTLQLDARYHLIALIIAMARFEQVGVGQQPMPLSTAQVRDRCIDFGRDDILSDTHTHAFDALLDEMAGLGVLQYINGGYVLRSGNVAMMIGSETEVMDALSDFQITKSLPKDRSTERRQLSQADEYTRSPLTPAQEYSLVYDEENPISVLFGNSLSGLEQIPDILKDSLPSSAVYRPLDRPMVNAQQFVKVVRAWINKEDDRDKALFVVTPQATWNIRWLRAIGDLKKLLVQARIGIVFLGDAGMARQIAEDGGVPSEIKVESIVPWSRQTLSSFLKSASRTELDTQEISRSILEGTGHAGPLITDIVKAAKIGGRDIDDVLARFAESLGTCNDILQHFGLRGTDHSFVTGLSSILPVKPDEVREAFSLVSDTPVNINSGLLEFCEWSGLLHMTTENEYDVNSLLRRCVAEEKDDE